MGNSNTKESRTDHGSGYGGRERLASISGGLASEQESRGARRMSRNEISFLGIGGSSSSRDRPDAPFERRETKQEREARRLERERAARAKERERSMREEHVDGGYLVTLGTYTGTEDFSKPVVRQLQIERKLAPFWRGLNDWSDSWAEHQLIAAARGLPIPAADAPPDPELVPRPPRPDPQSTSSQNIQNLTVPMGPRTLSAASDHSGSGVGSSLPSPTSTGRTSSPFKPRAKALAAALSGGSRNASSTDLTPKEVSLPHDPFVNGQALEVFLYKDATECPICFLTYPPYLNRTRCCDQPICSECFVQIKRADPHLPEHHPDGQARDPNEGLTPDDPPEMLISEPSACPYCQQPEFGVTYDPPPFRRGLSFNPYGQNPSSSTAMSSQSSLNSTLPPTSPSQPGRRRTHSLSANAPNVITTDRVRPDWATKLASARAHQARRSAAATALHTAAFLMGGTEQRSILRSGRFGRRGTGANNSSSNTPNEGQPSPANEPHDAIEPGARGSSRNQSGGRRSRMDELEDMMFMEAVRLSLAAEEERKRKEEKALRKDAKKREKEERKALKKAGRDPYGGSASGASASSLSLGLGRRRGNSTTSNLRMEATVQGASQASKSPELPPEPKPKDKEEGVVGKGKGVDRSPQEVGSEQASSLGSLPIPAVPGRGISHLRQMSNASSIGSSVGDSPSGSYTGQGYLGHDSNNPRSSGLSLGNYSDDGDRDAGSAGSEPMFNFSSLAQMVGANLEDGSTINPEGGEESESPGETTTQARPLSQVKEEDKEEAEAEHVEEGTFREEQGVTAGHVATPELTITPETPAPVDEDTSEGLVKLRAERFRHGQEPSLRLSFWSTWTHVPCVAKLRPHASDEQASWLKTGGEISISETTARLKAQTGRTGGTFEAQRGGIYLVPNWSSLGPYGVQGRLDQIDGAFYWGAWPNANEQKKNSGEDVLYKNVLAGKPYMMGVSPYFYTNLPQWNKNWWSSSESLWYDRWQQVLNIMPEMVQIITWNDYGESSYIGDIVGKQIVSGAEKYVNGYKHAAFRSILPYLIKSYKAGNKNVPLPFDPTAIAWYRTTPARAGGDGGTIWGQGGTQSAANGAKDVVSVETITVNDVDIKVCIGSSCDTYRAKGSVNHVNYFEKPFNGATGPSLSR